MDQPPDVDLIAPATPAEVATDLVTQYPGSTIGELLCYTGLADLGTMGRHQGRQALVPALHAAEAKGTVIRGPMRQCQQGSGRVSTWLPATASFAAGASPMLRGLEDLVARAAAQQEAEEA